MGGLSDLIEKTEFQAKCQERAMREIPEIAENLTVRIQEVGREPGARSERGIRLKL